MSASSYQLPLEQTLKTLLVSQALNLPPIHCGHASEKIESEPDYLSIIARKPGGDLAYTGCPEIVVEFDLVHSVADEGAREAQSAAHASTSAALIDLFNFDNTQATLAALRDAGLTYGLGFTGWESVEGEDGVTAKDQLVDKQRYIFDVHLL